MGEVLSWTVAVFAVVGGPPLLALWSELRRERKETERRDQRHSEDDGGHTRRSGKAARSSSLSGAWPGMFLVPWTL